MFRKKPFSFSAALCLSLLAALLGAGGARADEDDPPTRVARLAYTQGSVGFQPAGTQDWVAAPLNRPLTTGDKLWSDRDGRAELQLDGSLLQLADATAVSFLNLGDHVTQIRLTAGTLIVRVRRLDDDETYEVDTPNLAFSILRPGLYRITVGEFGQSTAIGIRRGQGEVTGAGSAYAIHANEYDVFSGTSELAEDVHPYDNADPFDAWSASRDDRSERSMSARYVSPDVVGYEDLDDQGSWSETPDYGYVWFPSTVATDWAPYHDGYWAYIAPWGYTWVDQQRWGFAPFHYGRWIAVRGSWGWVPAPPPRDGTVYVRPIYAPALVAWVGIGAGVAWVALGPREVYVPSYPVSRRYMTAINISNTTVNKTAVNNLYNTTIINNRAVNPTNMRYINRKVPGAVAATTAQAFATAQPVAANRVRLDARALSNAQVQPLPPAVRPTHQALLGAARTSAVQPPATVQARAVIARNAPPELRGIPSSAASRPAVRVAPPATSAPRSPEARMPARPAMSNGTARRPAAGAIHPRELPPVPMPRSPGLAESALERQHLQSQQQLRARQEEERQRVQMQQQFEHEQQAKQQADAARQQQLERQHEQQTQELAQQHAQQQQQLQAQQEAERRQQESQTKPATRREERPPSPRP